MLVKMMSVLNLIAKHWHFVEASRRLLNLLFIFPMLEIKLRALDMLGSTLPLSHIPSLDTALLNFILVVCRAVITGD
jgi:hypothetical protein